MMELPLKMGIAGARPNDRIGIIGLGIMGSAMSANLIDAGFATFGYDVRARRRGEFSRRGGHVARSAGDVAKRSAIVITSLPSPATLRDVATELASARGSAQIIIETSTLPIAVKKE